MEEMEEMVQREQTILGVLEEREVPGVLEALVILVD
jgi:hypothetical protein